MAFFIKIRFKSIKKNPIITCQLKRQTSNVRQFINNRLQASRMYIKTRYSKNLYNNLVTNEKVVICMPSKNLSVAKYWGTRHVPDEYSTIIKTWMIIWMVPVIFYLYTQKLRSFFNISQYPKNF